MSQNENYFVFLCVFVFKIGYVYPVGESAVVKNGAARAVRSGAAVTANANDLFEFCNTSHLNKQPGKVGCWHSLQRFFFIPRIRNRPVKTLKDTQSLHSVKSVDETEVPGHQRTVPFYGKVLAVDVNRSLIQLPAEKAT